MSVPFPFLEFRPGRHTPFGRSWITGNWYTYILCNVYDIWYYTFYLKYLVPDTCTYTYNIYIYIHICIYIYIYVYIYIMFEIHCRLFYMLTIRYRTHSTFQVESTNYWPWYLTRFALGSYITDTHLRGSIQRLGG